MCIRDRDRTVKQVDILLYSSDIISETLQSQAADIFSINSDPSLLSLIHILPKIVVTHVGKLASAAVA